MTSFGISRCENSSGHPNDVALDMNRRKACPFNVDSIRSRKQEIRGILHRLPRLSFPQTIPERPAGQTPAMRAVMTKRGEQRTTLTVTLTDEERTKLTR